MFSAKNFRAAGTIHLLPGSAVVSTAVCGVSPKTLLVPEDSLKSVSFFADDWPARRRPKATGTVALPILNLHGSGAGEGPACGRRPGSAEKTFEYNFSLPLGKFKVIWADVRRRAHDGPVCHGQRQVSDLGDDRQTHRHEDLCQRIVTLRLHGIDC